MNRSSTVMFLGESWRFGNLPGRATTILNHLKHSGWIVVDCGRGLNRSATVARSGSFLAAPWVESWPFLSVRDESGWIVVLLTSRITCHMKTAKSCTFVGDLDAAVALLAWTVVAPYRTVTASWAFLSIPAPSGWTVALPAWVVVKP